MAMKQSTASLPAWARRRIETLERQLAERDRKIAQLSEGPAESDTVVNSHGIYPDRELGTGVEVTFRLPDGSEIRAAVRGKYVELNAIGPELRSWSISAQPSSGNVLRVRPVDWR